MSSTPPTVSAGPAWDAIPHDVRCPLCDYNLRGLTEPRCPECGHRFEWAVVTDPTRRLHPYLFEHHPERNVRSFVRTLWGTLRPGRFWDSLPANQPMRPGRMMIYWLLAMGVASTAVLGQWARATYAWWAEVANVGWTFYTPYSSYPRNPLQRPEMTWDDLRKAATVAWGVDGPLLLTAWLFGLWLIWPWLTLAALQVFRASMRRARVKGVHVLRCLVYTFDVGAWLGLCVAAWGVAAIWVAPRQGVGEGPDFTPLVLLGAGVLLITWRLGTAYRRYMRFDHAWSTVIASQVIATLLAINLLVLWENLRHPGY